MEPGKGPLSWLIENRFVLEALKLRSHLLLQLTQMIDQFSISCHFDHMETISLIITIGVNSCIITIDNDFRSDVIKVIDEND